MNIKEYLTELNPWWNDNMFRFNIIEREFYLKQIQNKESKNNSLDILVGARRVGKTSLMKSIINSLLNDKKNPKQIIYLTSESKYVQSNNIDIIIREVKKEFDLKEKRIYLFIDEVQDIKDWQNDIKYLYDNTNINAYITGSSSLILTPQTSKLTGRFKLHHILGLSFTEFLKFSKYSLNRKNQLQYLEEYLLNGGYPEYVLTKDLHKLTDAIQSTLYRDLLSTYGIRNPSFLSELIDYLADKVTTSVSPLNIQKDLKVNDETARFYLKYLQDVYLIFPVFKKGNSNKITKSSVPKYYFSDTGILAKRTLKPRMGHLAENAVYLHFLRRNNLLEYPGIFYSIEENQEVDFYVKPLDEYYEVKYKDQITKEELIKYQLIQKNIKFIVRNLNPLFHNTLPDKIQISIIDFLLG